MKSIAVLCIIILADVSAVGQTAIGGSPVISPTVQVPPVIQFSNVVTDLAGNPLTGTVEMTFSLYNSSERGQVLWSEKQNVLLDSTGHYSVYLGITQTNGVPMKLFTAGEAHWLGVQIPGQAELPRVFLVSVPYALKAADAETLSGMPASAFVRATSDNANVGNATRAAPSKPDTAKISVGRISPALQTQ